MLEKILEEYEEYRTIAEIERKKRIKEVYEKYPEIQQTDNDIFRAGSENMKNLLKNPEKNKEINEKFKQNMKALKEKKESLIKKYNIDKNYDKVAYNCKLCKDTGFTEDGKRCVCLKQRLINEAYAKSNLGEILENENFDKFSFDYYSKAAENGDLSPYDNIKIIYNRTVNFCKNFDNETKGLIFYGSTGLGKTFLSSCIAKDLIENGKTIIYSRAAKLFGIYEDYKFGRNPDKSLIDEMFKCDLLIIDDLGTEPKSTINNSFLFEIINERMSENKKIIINTNYDLSELTKIYSQRFTSRVFEYFIPNKFIGEDIRVQKLKQN